MESRSPAVRCRAHPVRLPALSDRYYLNNFQDGSKQDALDYVVGNFEPSKGEFPAQFLIAMK